MILRVAFNKKNYLKYLGHLDLMRLFQRSFARADISLKHSEGFNPHPKFSIASPLSLGIESEEEYMDIELKDIISLEDFIERMNKILPQDIQITNAAYLDKEEPIASLISWSFYEMEFEIAEIKDRVEIEGIFKDWISQEEIMITRFRKKGKKKIESKEDVKGFIWNLVIKNINNNNITIDVLLKTGANGNLRPSDFIEALDRDTNLGVDLDSTIMRRLGLYAEKNNNIYKPL